MANPYPDRYTAAAFGGARGFLFIPRVGEIVAPPGSIGLPRVESDGWAPPYEDAEGEPISEDGVNPGTIGPGMDRYMPALTDDDGTTRNLVQRQSGEWYVRRTPPGNFGNLDWANADGTDALSWIGPPNRYWGWTVPGADYWYQRRLYRRGKLLATTPPFERVIGCAAHREGTARLIVAATTRVARSEFSIDLDEEGQIDDTELFCRLGGGDPESAELWDGAEFDALVAQYEGADTDTGRAALRADIEAYARRWHQAGLRDHAALIDTSVPEMQEAEHPRRLYGTDVWPMHFNASGTEGQTLRRQGAHVTETLPSGAEIEGDVFAYRYERIKVAIDYGLTTVTVDAGTTTAFEVTVLVPQITPQRIHGERLPRLDITPVASISDASEAEPGSPSNGQTYRPTDLDNDIDVTGQRSASIVAAVDYDGDDEIFAEVDIVESVDLTGAIQGHYVREYQGSWQFDSAHTEWQAATDRSTAATLELPWGSVPMTSMTVEATIDTTHDDPSSAGGDETASLTYASTVTRSYREIQFLDLRRGVAVTHEEEETIEMAASFAPHWSLVPRVASTQDGWEVIGSFDDATAGFIDQFDNITETDFPATQQRHRRRRTTLHRAGLVAEVLVDSAMQSTEDFETSNAQTAFRSVSFLAPPFKTEMGDLVGQEFFISVKDYGSSILLSPVEGDPPMVTTGLNDSHALGGLEWFAVPVGDWAVSPDGALLLSQIVTVPIYEGLGLTPVDVEYEPVNLFTGGDLVTLNGLTVPDGEAAAFYSCTWVGA